MELRLIAEARYDGTPARQPEPSDYIDLTPVGHSHRDQIREMAVTITADRNSARTSEGPRPARRSTYMARQFGFLDAAEDMF